MSVPPLPYSRSRVMIFTDITGAPGSLVYRYRAAMFYFLHQENEGNHGGDADAENPEIVNVSEHGGLAIQIEGHHSVGLAGGFGGAGAAGGEHVGDVGKRGLELAVARIEPGGEIGLMHLGAACEHGGD